MQTLLVSDSLTSLHSISNQGENVYPATDLGRSLVIIDTNLDDYPMLMAGVPLGYEVHLLDADQCGIAQITQILHEQINIASLHILSHGQSGKLLLGKSVLSLENLSDYEAQLQVWRSALSKNAEILLYGCEVAKGDRGLQFIQQLAEKTGSAIAASTTLTGDADQGGDWELQVQTRSLQTALLSLTHYRGVLINFGNPTTVTADRGPTAVAVGDIDGDGDLDIVTGNYVNSNATVLLGDGQGGFTSNGTVALGATPQDVVLADVNGDGRLDLISANQGAGLNTGSVSVRLGNGDGTFSGSTNTIIGSFVLSVALGDFDRDNLPDIVATAGVESWAAVLRNTGGGNFASPSNVTTGGIGYPRDVAVGDINGDNDLDLVILNPDANPSRGTSLSIRTGSTDATFTGSTNLTSDIGSAPQAVELADIDKDNDLDLLILDAGTGNILVRRNQGNGTFASSTTVSIGAPGSTAAFKVVDLDGDSNLDLIVSSFEGRSVPPNFTNFGSAWVLTGDGTGSFSAPIEISLGPDFTASKLAVGDFNGDGKTDIVVGNAGNGLSNIAVILQTSTPPTTSNASVTLNEDTVFTFGSGNFSFNDVDQGDTLQAVRISQLPAAGQLFLDANNNNTQDQGEAVTANQTVTLANLTQLKFAPAANANGNNYTTFQFQVGDGSVFSTAATMTINVAPTPDAPARTGNLASLSNGSEDTTYTINAVDLLAGFTDADNDPLSVTNLTASNGNLVNNGNGTWSFTPNTNFNGTVNLSYTVTDGNGGSVPATNSFNLTASNDNPTGNLTITGTVQQNSVLTADTSTIQDPEGLGAFSYAWEVLEGNNWTPIISANQQTFTPDQDQVGKRLRVKITYTDQNGTVETLTSNQTNLVGNVNDAPTGSFSITGTAREDAQLSADTSDVQDRDGLGVFSYQWQVQEGNTWQNIVGATSSNFMPQDPQVGKRVRVGVSYTDGYGTSETYYSDPIGLIQSINDVPTGVVSITGTPRNANPLTANVDTLRDNDGLGSLSYQWQVLRSGVWSDLPGAVANRFTPDSSLVGSPVRVRVSYTDLQGTQETVFSTASGAIADNLITGTPNKDVLHGTAFDDKIYGLADADVLRGHGGNDYLHGGADNDILDGGAGNDLLFGAAGLDRITGGEGQDVFGLHRGTGLDTIVDFRDGQDRIGLSGGLRFANLWIRQAVGGTEIGILGTNTALMMLNNVQRNQITAADFTTVTL